MLQSFPLVFPINHNKPSVEVCELEVNPLYLIKFLSLFPSPASYPSRKAICVSTGALSISFGTLLKFPSLVFFSLEDHRLRC